jgi:hypothetical protein
MPRQPKLRQKAGYWCSEAGAPGGKYFGKVGEVTHSDAMRRFRAFLASISAERPTPSAPARRDITVRELMTKFLAWLERYRSDRTQHERKRHLERFCRDYGGLPGYLDHGHAPGSVPGRPGGSPAPTRWKLREAIRLVNRTLAELHVEPHPDKTFIGRISRGFDFVGYAFTPAGLEAAPPAIERCVERVSRLYERGVGTALVAMDKKRSRGVGNGIVRAGVGCPRAITGGCRVAGPLALAAAGS